MPCLMSSQRFKVLRYAKFMFSWKMKTFSVLTNLQKIIQEHCDVLLFGLGRFKISKIVAST